MRFSRVGTRPGWSGWGWVWRQKTEPALPVTHPPSGCLGHAAITDVRLLSRVHITEATLNHLDKAYEVEDGHGEQRDPYLKEMNIRTYLVIDPRVRGLGGGEGWAAWEQGLNYWSLAPKIVVRW